MYGVEGIRGVSASAVAMGAAASIFDGITTSQLHEALVKSAADLISPEAPNYSQVAARLNIFKIRKDAFGRYDYPNFYQHIVKNVNKGVYDKDLLTHYSFEEIEELGNYIKPKRDDLLAMQLRCSCKANTSFKTVLLVRFMRGRNISICW